MKSDMRDVLALIAASVFAIVVLVYGGIMLWCAAPDERMAVFKEIGGMALPTISLVFGYYFGKAASHKANEGKPGRNLPNKT